MKDMVRNFVVRNERNQPVGTVAFSTKTTSIGVEVCYQFSTRCMNPDKKEPGKTIVCKSRKTGQEYNVTPMVPKVDRWNPTTGYQLAVQRLNDSPFQLPVFTTDPGINDIRETIMKDMAYKCADLDYEEAPANEYKVVPKRLYEAVKYQLRASEIYRAEQVLKGCDLDLRYSPSKGEIKFSVTSSVG